MKYKGSPNQMVTMSSVFDTSFSFDEKGIFDSNVFIENQKEKLEQRLKVHFESIEDENSQEKQEGTKVYKCKKCDFETENKGTLLAHYREEHPKEEGAE